ncbi:hypothetical protein ULMS_24210 [Patiriisocius marinistellae]|uniref:DUF302 domain-containing protein n=1 Tax=Patiriisocius marinistellae TaxID=2494560 RepID=A0A5J4FXY1_9FLAO|nr:DUF302 domain-containing protein [Patiriisocius marinistellae]GEQ86913.1 hypothetical protein ULMS_24210 [Patiriisocius marinistellae]
MKYFLFLTFSLALLSCTSCNKNDDNNGGEVTITTPETRGLGYSLSEKDFSNTYLDLRSALQSNPNISIVAEVNHTQNAQNNGLELPNTRVILFGNPALGTPLMQEDQLAGLDLPQKMLVYENADNNVFVAFNTTTYLSARHDVGSAQTIGQISAALNNIATGVTNGTASENPATSITLNQGISTVVSDNNFNLTYSKLRNSIMENENLTVVAELDHQANAQSVNMELNPTRLIVFGNPNLGTPLMQNKQTTAIDLPQKMLVWEDAQGVVKISYNTPSYLKDRHAINGNDEVINTINTALFNLAENAAN